MLFSEPKIPQFHAVSRSRTRIERFQCSSASRKFLNLTQPPSNTSPHEGFSALQRAENSSMRGRIDLHHTVRRFQCSSASRKFLNSASPKRSTPPRPRFSALQRAENSSIRNAARAIAAYACFSALQRAENSSIPTLAPASIHISDRDDHASSFLSLPGASP